LTVSFAVFLSEFSYYFSGVGFDGCLLIVSFSKVYCLEFASSSVSWLLDSILCAFSELFLKKGKKHYYYLKCLLGLKDILQYFLWPHTGGALI